MGKAASAERITKPVPPLRDGDRMGVREFLRRYAADPEVHTAELLKGVVYVTRRRVIENGTERIMPPISAEGHAEPGADITTWLGVYAAYTPGVQRLGPVTTILPDSDTGLEPDAVLRILPESGGGSVIGSDKFVHDRPELLVEVSFSSGGRDLGPKYEAFEQGGVSEYLVWRTRENVIDWFVLKRKKYVPLAPHADGTLRSETFPGLWLDPTALLARDMATVLGVVQKGIASAEHKAFVAKLARAAAKRKK